MEDPSGGGATILHKVKQSAEYVASHARDVHIKRAGLESFVEKLDLAKVTEFKPHRFPLQFDSLQDEVNLWALLDLLNFGSGFRHVLHKHCHSGAYQTIIRGVLSMHISGDKLDSTFLQKMDVGQVANLFDLKLQEEKELKEAVFFVSSPTALVPLAETIQRVMNETGTILLAKGFKEGLGQWVLDFVRQTEGCTAAQLVESLANTFPAFRDVATYNGQDVYILKKAQLLAADLFRQLGEKEPAFLFADVTELTIFSDNVIPAVLREYGVLELSEELAAHVDHKTVLEPGDREVELRCVAIHACEEIVKLWKAKSGAEGGQPVQLNAMLLDYFLWEMGKQGHFRKVERHYTTDTAFY